MFLLLPFSVQQQQIRASKGSGGGHLHSADLSKGFRLGEITPVSWLASNWAVWAIQLSATRTFPIAKVLGRNPTPMSPGAISVQGKHCLCSIPSPLMPLCSLVEICPALLPFLPVLHLPSHNSLPHGTLSTTTCLVLIALWHSCVQPCRACANDQEASLVYSQEYVFVNLLHWNKRKKEILWSHSLFLILVLIGCPEKNKKAIQ